MFTTIIWHHNKHIIHTVHIFWFSLSIFAYSGVSGLLGIGEQPPVPLLETSKPVRFFPCSCWGLVGDTGNAGTGEF